MDAASKNVDDLNAKKAAGSPSSGTLRKQLATYEQERTILLALGDDITKVREKGDLIALFSSRLKGLFYFTHTIVMLVDQHKQTYTPFLLDPNSSPIKDHPDYAELIKKVFPLDAPIISQVTEADGPLTFQLEKILHTPELPSFIRINYERGIREMMITPLKSRMEIIGFILVYSDRADSFTSEFKALMHGIAPQLSSAVLNIIINEEIDRNERVNEVLLSLSNEMVTVRNRPDLLRVINTKLKKLIDFSHNVMTVLEENGETYKAFLTDPNSKSKDFSKYTEAISIPYPVNDGIYNVAVASDQPLLFDIRSLDLSAAPLWLKLNHAAGAREMLIKVLPEDGTPKHCLILFADKLNSFSDEGINIVNRISSQLATAAQNITANEAILSKEQEKSFLLDFSQDIAGVRTKDDLQEAITSVLQRVLNIRLAMIRLIEDDGISLKPYMYDKTLFHGTEDAFTALFSQTISIDEYLTAKVLNSKCPVIFNVEEEDKKGKSALYLNLWKKIGLKNAYGAPLRVGDKNIGTLWLLTDEINLTLLKGICAQISIAIANIQANEKVLAYKQQLEFENDHLKEQIKSIYNFSEIIGSGPEMNKVYQLMSRVAESNSTVLILGETGTGKELIARAIHNASPRQNKLMVKVNCAALPANLIESELFGHEKGSFTGAFDRRIGKFELANNSTLFLDEIGEMPLELQVKLLRVIQERELERVGGKTTVKVDVRIIAATNVDLETEVKNGKFRADLYYRLNVFPIHLPPLRQRPEDIAPLANFFLARYSKLSGTKMTGIAPKVLQQLRAYAWPGNVRELEHLIERSVLLANDSVLREINLPKGRNDNQDQPDTFANSTLENLERRYIIEVLKRCSGKIAGRAAPQKSWPSPPRRCIPK
ncbi:sigma-54-dependent Fis family transcriptional regulator [Hymenobacter volaticus]|uniref:Sigma 54-interacting transcriptional regulator n=1 Tax=Hymenobacter volaticus TaxID=2932254 RepID=A0ABY4GET7_9BACT|nr:sigma 54-interacting transcriptional regulator [Hymenobacter volaticus]UOQ69447.1 sigma 54-interacting transcriptional regulator [Hymenobacter volaticus]